MLVVNRVVLVLLHQPHKMWKFERYHAEWFEDEFDAGDEVVEVGHLSQDIIADDEIGLFAFRDQLSSGLLTEELDLRRHALLDGDASDVGGRFDAQTGDAYFDEVREQV